MSEHPPELRLVFELGSAWIVEYAIHAQAGQPVIGQVRVLPRSWLDGRNAEPVPLGGLSTTTLRKLRLSDVLPHLEDVLHALRAEGIHPTPALKTERKSPAGRKPTLSDEYLARIAQTYEEATKRNEPPLVAVGESFGLDRATAKSRIEVARRRRLLTRPLTKGKSRGHLTSEGRDVIERSQRAARKTKTAASRKK